MVMPVCSDGVNDMFEKNDFNLTIIRDRCLRDYGIVPDPDLATREWGPGPAKDLSFASNIIFSNGDRDPWSAGGVTVSHSPSVHLVQIPHACHHEDLRSPGPDDPPALLAARQEEADIIAGWIKQFRRDQRRRNFV
jgi:lysosomal Pro-X carboxypeptidase